MFEIDYHGIGYHLHKTALVYNAPTKQNNSLFDDYFQSEAFRHTSMNALYVHVLRASGMFETFLKDEFSACQQESVLNPRVGSHELP